MNNNGRRWVWVTVVSLVLNVVLFAFVSVGFIQGQYDRAARTTERDVAALRAKGEEHDAELKAIEVSLAEIKEQLRAVRDELREIKEAVR